jgi:hypothetical protein
LSPAWFFFVSTGELRGVMFAFAALCLSALYGDRSFRPAHLAGCAVASGLLMPAAVWLQAHPALYVPIFAVAGVAHVLVSRSAILPPQVPTWVLIFPSTRGASFMAKHGRPWSPRLFSSLPPCCGSKPRHNILGLARMA